MGIYGLTYSLYHPRGALICHFPRETGCGVHYDVGKGPFCGVHYDMLNLVSNVHSSYFVGAYEREVSG